MAQEIQTTLQPDERGNMPMEVKLKELRTDPRVTMFLLPLPKSAAKESEKASSSTPGTKSTPGAPAAPIRPLKKAKPSAKAKSLCPQELKGFPQRDSLWQCDLLGIQFKDRLQK